MSRTPPHRRKLIVATLLLAVLLMLAAWAYLVYSQPEGTRISLIFLSGMSASAGPIDTAADADLSAKGWRCEYVSRTALSDRFAFIRRDTHSATIRVMRSKESAPPPTLYYSLFGPNDEQLSNGIVTLGDTAEQLLEIRDANLADAKRIMIHEKPNQ